MSDDAVRDLPPIPGGVSLDEARGIVAAFGWELAIRPAKTPRQPVGFAVTPEGQR